MDSINQLCAASALVALANDSLERSEAIGGREHKGMEAFVCLLGSKDVNIQSQASLTLGALAKASPGCSAAIAEAGCIESLVRLLRSSDINVQTNAASALSSLAKGSLERSAAIAALRGIELLVRLVDSATSGPGLHFAAMHFAGGALWGLVRPAASGSGAQPGPGGGGAISAAGGAAGASGVWCRFQAT